MSGIAGIHHLDSAPVDRSFIATMADALAFRGPDAQNIWADGPIGFAHTLLASTFESEGERQPATLDGQVWITADARIDGRQDLAREFGLPLSALQRPDCELILHAYAKWGESCVDHLLGDFAFAIWDGRARKLFCARDHFGVKPFFYAHLAEKFIFSNTLSCIRLHEGVSEELNELAIADFLIFDFNQDPATTTFKEIQRLPAGHVLTATSSGIRIRRYWSLPEGEKIRHRRTCDYVEHFSSLLEIATVERLRTKRVGVLMSGGLDSSAVAAFASAANPPTELKAHTYIFERVLPDDEKHFAALAASALGVPIEFTPLDNARLFESADDFGTPEPVANALWSSEVQYYRRVAADTPITLNGEGGDVLLTPSPLLTWEAVREIPPLATAASIARYLWQFRMLPRFRLRSTLLTLLGCPRQLLFRMPPWTNATFASRVDLTARIEAANANSIVRELRPVVRHSLRSPYWPARFEMQDAGWIGRPAEYRRPFFDVRLVAYLLGIPDLPYSIEKYLLRLALRGRLPRQICRRPKTPLRGDPFETALRCFGASEHYPLRPHPLLNEFVDTSKYSLCSDEFGNFRNNLRVISLNLWLDQREQLWKKQRSRTKRKLNDVSIQLRNCAYTETSTH